MSKATVCLDFDGVLNTYRGWGGENELYKPRPGVVEFLGRLEADDWRLVVFTTRTPDKVWSWLMKYELSEFFSDVTNTKPPAVAYIDDRALTFDGDFEGVFAKLQLFEPYWKPNKLKVPDLEMIWGLKVDLFAEVLKRGCSLHISYDEGIKRYSTVVADEENYAASGDTLLESTHKAIKLWTDDMQS